MGKLIEVLIDSDAFVGRFYPDDIHHKRTKSIFSALEKEQKRIITTSYVVMETATVLSHKSGQDVARKFLDQLESIKFPIIHIDEPLQKETISFFKKQPKKGTSVVDCSNVVVMNQLEIPTIFSFDKFYGKFQDLKTLKGI